MKILLLASHPVSWEDIRENIRQAERDLIAYSTRLREYAISRAQMPVVQQQVNVSSCLSSKVDACSGTVLNQTVTSSSSVSRPSENVVDAEKITKVSEEKVVNEVVEETLENEIPAYKHYQWAQKRAFEYLDKGDVLEAKMSFLGDMSKHPVTALFVGEVKFSTFALLMLQDVRAIKKFMSEYNIPQ